MKKKKTFGANLESNTSRTNLGSRNAFRLSFYFRKMGSGASKVKSQIAEASSDEMVEAIKGMSPEEMAKVKAAIAAAEKGADD